MADRLAHTRSAYLRSAAHQPIDWYEFGEEAFEKAKSQDKPILLDIGAVWCHWCHVIDRESYENPEIAEIINEHFIPIKVDRDERPDIDARYQQAVSAISGQGGWPLTGFLTYDGRVMYGGTYFPPQVMKNLLLQIHEVYRTRKAELFRHDEVLTDETVDKVRESLQVDTVALDDSQYDEFVKSVLESAQSQFDGTYGGFGMQPKFPHYSALTFLIAYNAIQPDPAILNMLDKTLTAMAEGGIYDQIAGGFHRYSVDQFWHVPHFEKMAYDNAEAIQVYAQAYRLTGNPLYRKITLEIIEWVNVCLRDKANGGFYASQDADIDLHDDGDHFTWTLAEMREILSPQEMELTSRYYGVDATGDMHERPGRNVLRITISLETLASQMGIPLETADHLLASAKAKILARRHRRPIPFIDQTLYLNWNAMFVAAYFEAALLLEDDSLLHDAQRSLEMLIHEFYAPEIGVLHTQGPQGVPGFLDDYAQFINALLKGFYATAGDHYLHLAQTLADRMIRDFGDVSGGFCDTGSYPALGLLKLPRKPVEDNPSASPNGIAMQVLLQLSVLLEQNRDYDKPLRQALNYFIPKYRDYGIYVSALGLAALWTISLPLKIEVIRPEHMSQEQEKIFKQLVHEAKAFFMPGKQIMVQTSDSVFPEARICTGRKCFALVKSVHELRQKLSIYGAESGRSENRVSSYLPLSS